MQMQPYPFYHRNRVNLALHLVMVPVFVACFLGGLVAVAMTQWLVAAACAGGLLVSLAAQRLGHRLEPNPSVPFAGPGDFLRRILKEQFLGFPRFVLSGGWLAGWRAGGQ